MDEAINPLAQSDPSVGIVIYSKDNCSSCVRVKMLLDNYGATYRVVDVSGDIDAMRHVAKLTGRMTLPQVVVNGELLGGYEETQLALRNPRIREAVEASS